MDVLTFKKYSLAILCAFSAIVAVSCAKSEVAAEAAKIQEENTLAMSSFYPGENAPGMRAAAAEGGGDSGTIQGPGSSSGGDKGSIPQPGTGGGSSSGGSTSPGSNSGGSSSGGTAGGASSGGSAGGLSGGSSSGGSAGNTAPGGSSSGGSISPGGAGSDGGTIGGNAGGTGGDGGSVGGTPGGSGGDGGSASNGGSSGGSSGSSGGSTGTDPGSSSGGTAGNTNPGGSSSGGSSSGNDGGQANNGGASGSGGDGGSLGGSSGSGGDGGSASNGGSSGGSSGSSGGSTGNTNPGGSSSGGNDQANNGTNPGSSGGSSSGGDGGSVPGGSSGGQGNDGGSVGGNSGSNGGDGGSASNGGSSGGSSSGGTTNPGGNSGGGTAGNTNPGGNDGGQANNGSNPGSGSSGGDGGSVGGTPGGSGGDGGQANNGGNSGGTNPGNGSESNPGSGSGGAGNDIPNPKPPTWVDIIKDILKKIEDIVKGNDGEDNDGGTAGNTNPGGSGGEGGTIPGGCKGPYCAPNDKKINIDLANVCSQMRSGYPYPKFVFFQEAKRPLFTVEASISTRMLACEAKQTSWASMGFNYRPKVTNSARVRNALHDNTAVLASQNLAGVDLLSDRYHTDISFDVNDLKREYPTTWRDIVVTARVCDDTNNDGRCSDETVPWLLSVNNPVFTLEHVPSKILIDVWSGRNLNLNNSPLCQKQYSPLLLDMTGQGFKLSGPEGGVYFDLDATGEPIATGWTAADNVAFLVRDLNDNGTIDDGSELFGSATLLKNGKRAVNGFQALKDLDDDDDNKFTKDDSAWRETRLWFDKNRDGEAQRGELFTLDKFKIESINMDYVDVSEVDPHGNETRQRSTFRRKVDGKSTPLLVIDIWFATLTRQ